MASFLNSIPQLPAPQAAFVDRGTGLINRAWYEYFKRLDAHVREIETRLDTIDTSLTDLDNRVTDLETP